VKQLPGISHWVQQRRTTSGKRVATEVSGLALLQRRYERASVIRVDIAAGPDRLFAPAMHQGK